MKHMYTWIYLYFIAWGRPDPQATKINTIDNNIINNGAYSIVIMNNIRNYIILQFRASKHIITYLIRLNSYALCT